MWRDMDTETGWSDSVFVESSTLCLTVMCLHFSPCSLTHTSGRFLGTWCRWGGTIGGGVGGGVGDLLLLMSESSQFIAPADSWWRVACPIPIVVFAHTNDFLVVVSRSRFAIGFSSEWAINSGVRILYPISHHVCSLFVMSTRPLICEMIYFRLVGFHTIWGYYFTPNITGYVRLQS